MSSKLEPVIWLRILVTLAYMKGRTDVRTYVCCTDVHDVIAIKPNFLTSMGYHIFLSMVLRARARSSATILPLILVTYIWMNFGYFGDFFSGILV